MNKWEYQDPAKVVEYKENGLMMKDPKVRQWARGLALLRNRQDQDQFLKMIPERYRDAVRCLARCAK